MGGFLSALLLCEGDPLVLEYGSFGARTEVYHPGGAFVETLELRGRQPNVFVDGRFKGILAFYSDEPQACAALEFYIESGGDGEDAWLLRLEDNVPTGDGEIRIVTFRHQDGFERQHAPGARGAGRQAAAGLQSASVSPGTTTRPISEVSSRR